MCQISASEIMLVGGRQNGNCLGDYYILDTYPQSGQVKSVTTGNMKIFGEDVEVWPL